MAKNKYYAVRKGRIPGIYRTWSECQKQVTGYPGAVFKGFVTEEEAQSFLHPGQSAKAKWTENERTGRADVYHHCHRPSWSFLPGQDPKTGSEGVSASAGLL